MFKRIVLLISMLISRASVAGDAAPAVESGVEARSEEYEHLVPESGILFEPGYSYHYQETLLGFLLAGFDINRKCQMVVEERAWGSSEEFAVFMAEDKQTRRLNVIRRSAKKSIGQAVSAALFDQSRPAGADYASYLKIKSTDIAESRAPLSGETAAILSKACAMMLGTTRYPKKTRLLLHPAAVHFAHHDTVHGYRAGKTEFDRGHVGKFRRLLEQLGEVATVPVGERRAAERKVKAAAAALIAELAAAGVPVPMEEDNRPVPPPDQP